MRHLLLLVLLASFSLCFSQNSRAIRNRQTGLNSYRQIPDSILVKPSVSPLYTFPNINISNFFSSNNNFDGLKIYFGVNTDNEIVLLFCRAGWNGSTYNSSNISGRTRRASIDGTLYYQILENAIRLINIDSFQSMKNKYEVMFPNCLVKGYFLGRSALSTIISTNNRKIQIGYKNSQAISTQAGQAKINFHYISFGDISSTNVFSTAYTTYFGIDVSSTNHSRFGINTDEIYNTPQSIEFMRVSTQQYDEFTRSGGSKPCPPFGCQN